MSRKYSDLDLGTYVNPEWEGRGWRGVALGAALRVPPIVLPTYELRDFRIESMSVVVQHVPFTRELRAVARMSVPSVEDGRTVDVLNSTAIPEHLTNVAVHDVRHMDSLTRLVRGIIVSTLAHEVDEKLFMNGVRVTDPHARDYEAF